MDISSKGQTATEFPPVAAHTLLKPEELQEFAKDYAPAWRSFLSRHSLRDLLPREFELKFVRTTDTIRATYWALITNRVQAIPVYCETKKQFISFVGVLDIVAFLAKASREDILQPNFTFASLSYADEPVTRLVGASQQNQWYPVPANISLAALVESFIRYNFYRLPVIDPQNPQKILGIISQARLVRFLNDHQNELQERCDKRLEELGIDRMLLPPYCVPESCTLLDAFKIMNEKAISGVGIVNRDGVLVDAISASDSRYLILGDTFVFLRMTVTDYLQEVANFQQRVKQVQCCHKSEKLGSLLSRLAELRIHRIFVVDNQNKPIGVLALKDIVGFFSKQ